MGAADAHDIARQRHEFAHEKFNDPQSHSFRTFVPAAFAMNVKYQSVRSPTPGERQEAWHQPFDIDSHLFTTRRAHQISPHAKNGTSAAAGK
jgi:hypothetical protein